MPVSSAPDAEPHPPRAESQHRGAKSQLSHSHDDAGHGLGFQCATHSASAMAARYPWSMDIPRKSPVIMMRTISNGVRIACPVITRPTARKSTCTVFLVIEFSV